MSIRTSLLTGFVALVGALLVAAFTLGPARAQTKPTTPDNLPKGDLIVNHAAGLSAKPMDLSGDMPPVTLATFEDNADVLVNVKPHFSSDTAAGTFEVNEIPANGTVLRAYFMVMRGAGDASENTTITFAGTAFGRQTSVWTDIAQGYYMHQYRVDVTALVPRNGNYSYAVANTSFAHGVALVVVYRAADLPFRRIVINDGADSLGYASSTTSFADMAEGSGRLIVVTQGDNNDAIEPEGPETLSFNGNLRLGPGDVYSANQGSSASLIQLDVDIAAGTNTATVSTSADLLGFNLAILVADDSPPGTATRTPTGTITPRTSTPTRTPSRTITSTPTRTPTRTATPTFTPAAENVAWTNAVQVQVLGNSLKKLVTSGWNGGAVSNRSVLSGDAWASAVVTDTTSYYMFGLSRGDTDQGYRDIDYALYAYPATQQLLVYEVGHNRGFMGSYAVGDVLKVAVEGNTIKYYRNSTLIYLSSLHPAYPLLVDSTLSAKDSLLYNVKIAGSSFGATTLERETKQASAPACKASFSDVAASAYYGAAVHNLVCAGAVSGYADGTFRPFANTTRGQLLKTLALANGWAMVEHKSPTFSDVPAASPFYRYVETAVAWGIVGGYADGTFRPNVAVTRGQLAKILVKAMAWPLETPAQGHFSDVTADNAFYPYVETAYANGVISGYADGSFRLGASATRGQVAKIINLAVPLDAGN